MSKYTPAQYEESARKHGIPCGPYDGKQTHPGTIEIRYVRAVGGVELCVSYATAIGSQKLCDGFVRACESLPDLLIERDEKDAEIERLTTAAQNACDALHQWRAAENTNDAVELGNARTSRDKAYDELRAALKGGA